MTETRRGKIFQVYRGVRIYFSPPSVGPGLRCRPAVIDLSHELIAGPRGNGMLSKRGPDGQSSNAVPKVAQYVEGGG